MQSKQLKELIYEVLILAKMAPFLFFGYGVTQKENK